MITKKTAVSFRVASLVLCVVYATLSQAADDSPSLAKEQDPTKAAADTSVKVEQKQADDYYELLDSFVDTLDQIDRNYVKDVDRKRLIQAAIRGMLAELDPYSNFIAPEQFDRFETEVEGEFGGIGIQASVEGGQLRVISPLVGTPAYRSGMLADDVILEIDGKPTKGINLDEAVRRMKGAIGTEVTLKVLHADVPEPEAITLKRENILVQTVLGYQRKSDDSWAWMVDEDSKIAYVRITGFSRHTADELRTALEALTQGEMRGLVVDLRFNPGGLLSAAVQVSDMFIPEGRIVSTDGRNVKTRSWDARKKGTYEGFPMAVLVNGFSASASEIVAACLQDHDRAVIIGSRTWGKGSVQNVIKLTGGTSAVKLTTAGYHRPNGENIHRFPDSDEEDVWGVKPSDGFKVKLTRKERSQLMIHQRQKDIVRPHTDEETDSEETDNEDGDAPKFIDVQMAKALEYLKQSLPAEDEKEETAQAAE